MTAARHTTAYDGVKRGDLHCTTVPAVRAVLSRLAERANDAGVVTIYTADLVRSVGLSNRAVQYAVAQLLRDGWIWRAVRGQGSRALDFRGTPAPTVYVLRPLPTDTARSAIDLDRLRTAWTKYALSAVYRARPEAHRQAIRQAVSDAWTEGLLPVDNARPTRKEATTYTQPVASSITSGRTKYQRRTGHLRPVPTAVDQENTDDGYAEAVARIARDAISAVHAWTPPPPPPPRMTEAERLAQLRPFGSKRRRTA